MQDEADEAVAAPAFSLDKLTEVYIKIRDSRYKLQEEFKSRDKVLEEQLDTIAQQMLEVCKQANADSIKTPHGTIMRSVKSWYWTSDWDSMYQFIKEHGAYGLLEKRIHQGNMKEFLSDNPDTLPMGMNVEHSYNIVVRRAREK